jgi:transposase
MVDLLIEINRRVKDLKVEGFFKMPKQEMQIWQERYQSIIEKGIWEDAGKSPQILNKKGTLTKSKALQLLLKLQNYDLKTLAFMYDFGIPFDNNLALYLSIDYSEHYQKAV